MEGRDAMSVRAWRYTSIFCCIIRCTLYTPLTTIYKPKVYSIGAPHVRDDGCSQGIVDAAPRRCVGA